MITFKEASLQVGYNNQVHCPIKQQYAWYAYKKGEVHQFQKRIDAAKFSDLYEQFCSNQQTIDEWVQEQAKKHQQAVDVWREALKQDYVTETFSAAMFDVCYKEAFEKLIDATLDELATEINRLALFVTKINQIN
jgi:hypothetical protein